MNERIATILKAIAAVGACGAVGYVAYRHLRRPAATITVLPAGASPASASFGPRATVQGKAQWFSSSLSPALVAEPKEGLSYFATDLYARTSAGLVMAGRAVISISPEAEAHVVKVESSVTPWNPVPGDFVEVSGGPVSAGHARAKFVSLATHGVSGAPGGELHNFAGRRVTRIRGGRR